MTTDPRGTPAPAQVPRGWCGFCPLPAESMLQMQVADRPIAIVGLCANHARSLETRGWLLRLYSDGHTATIDARDGPTRQRRWWCS